MLKISQADYNLIRREAERRYPRECCGILLGKTSGEGREVTLTITCENADVHPETRYSIHLQQLVAASKLARSRHEDIVGFYHSHPDREPDVSPTDLAEANYFQHSYVITGVQQGRAARTQSFVLTGSEDDKRFEPEDIQVASQRAPHPAVAKRH